MRGLVIRGCVIIIIESRSVIVSSYVSYWAGKQYKHSLQKELYYKICPKSLTLTGVLTPVTISAKLFMQQLWQHKLNWNEPLTSELTIQWHDITTNLKQTLTYMIPQLYLQFNSSDQLILHVFVDASMKAYGTAA